MLVRVLVVKSGPPGPRSNLKDASRPDNKDKGRAENHGEQEGDREWRVCVRAEEVDLDSLKVQQDEDQQHHQQDQRRGQHLPSRAQAGPAERGGRPLGPVPDRIR
jgi:hypothetical protein